MLGLLALLLGGLLFEVLLLLLGHALVGGLLDILLSTLGLDILLAISKFSELGDEETIHIVDMGVDSLAEVHVGRETAFVVPHKARGADLEAGLDELDIAVVESVLHNSLVFLDGNGASRISVEVVRSVGYLHYDATGLTVRVDTVNGGLDQLTLQMA